MLPVCHDFLFLVEAGFFLQSLFYTHMSMLNTINKHGGRRMHTTNE